TIIGSYVTVNFFSVLLPALSTAVITKSFEPSSNLAVYSLSFFLVNPLPFAVTVGNTLPSTSSSATTVNVIESSVIVCPSSIPLIVITGGSSSISTGGSIGVSSSPSTASTIA